LLDLLGEVALTKEDAQERQPFPSAFGKDSFHAGV